MSKYVHQSWIGRNMMQRIYLQNNIFQGSVQLWSLYLANIWNIFAGIGRQLINEKKSMKWRKIRKRNDFWLGKDRKQLLYWKKQERLRKRKTGTDKKKKWFFAVEKIQSGCIGSSALWASTHPSLIITTNIEMEHAHVDNMGLENKKDLDRKKKNWKDCNKEKQERLRKRKTKKVEKKKKRLPGLVYPQFRVAS